MNALQKHLSEIGKKRWKGVSRKKRVEHMRAMAKKSWPTDPKERAKRIANLRRNRKGATNGKSEG